MHKQTVCNDPDKTGCITTAGGLIVKDFERVRMLTDQSICCHNSSFMRNISFNPSKIPKMTRITEHD